MHYHHCPNCYIHAPCIMDCSIQPDLEDDGKEFGSHTFCPVCEEEKEKEERYKSKEFWDRYNGFIK